MEAYSQLGDRDAEEVVRSACVEKREPAYRVNELVGFHGCDVVVIQH